jgi:hypothetical protein
VLPDRLEPLRLPVLLYQRLLSRRRGPAALGTLRAARASCSTAPTSSTWASASARATAATRTIAPALLPRRRDHERRAGRHTSPGRRGRQQQRRGRRRLRTNADFLGIRGPGVHAGSAATFGAVATKLIRSNLPDKEPTVHPLDHRLGNAQCRVTPTITTGLGAADLQHSWFISENTGYRAGT